MKFIYPIFILILILAIIFLLRFFHADVSSLHFWLNGLYGLYAFMTCVIVIAAAVGFDDMGEDDLLHAIATGAIMSIILALWTYAKFFLVVRHI